MAYIGDKKREYQVKWKDARRVEWIIKHGPCAKCGETNLVLLEIDHIDRTTKSVAISQIWSLTEERRNLELAKCQVLCETCHKEKTRLELTQKTYHGTNKGYKKGCRCRRCLDAHTKDRAEYRARTGHR